MDLLFTLGGFPDYILIRAYRQATGDLQQIESMNAVKTQLRMFIVKNALSGELQVTWLSYLQLCLNIYNQESSCPGFHINDSGLKMIILNDGLFGKIII